MVFSLIFVEYEIIFTIGRKLLRHFNLDRFLLDKSDVHISTCIFYSGQLFISYTEIFFIYFFFQPNFTIDQVRGDEV